MGKPANPEWERQARRMVWERYKAAKKSEQQLTVELSRAKAYITVLEHQLEACAEIVALAEKIITEGTPGDHP